VNDPGAKGAGPGRARVRPGHRLSRCAIAVLAIAAFHACMTTGFQSDDFVLIGRIDRSGFFASWGGPDGDLFMRPGTILSLMADRAVWGSRAGGFHATNLLLHIAACLLVMSIGKHVFELAGLRKPGLFSFLSACLFAVLPSHSEAVCWVSGRTDLLATVFGLAATLLFIRGRTVPALLLYAAGMLCKESILLLPAIWAIIPRPGEKRKSTPVIIALALAPAAYTAFRLVASPGLFEALTTGGQLASPGWSIGGNVVRALLRTFQPPLPQGAEETMRGLPPAVAALPLAAFTALVVFVIAHRKPSRALVGAALALAAVWLVALLPALRMKVAVFDTQSERFLYFPGTALILLFALLISATAGEGRAATVLLSASAALGFISTMHLARNWSEAGALCADIAGDPALSGRGNTVLANVPDNLNGAYVFRNGLDEAVAMACGTWPDEPVGVLSTHSVSSRADTVDVRVSGDSIRITIPGGERFCSVDGIPRSGGEGGTIALPIPAGAERILYYSSGSIRELMVR